MYSHSSRQTITPPLRRLRLEHKDSSISCRFLAQALPLPSASSCIAVPGIVRSSLLSLGQVGGTLSAINVHVALTGNDLNCSARCPLLRILSKRSMPELL